MGGPWPGPSSHRLFPLPIRSSPSHKVLVRPTPSPQTSPQVPSDSKHRSTNSQSSPHWAPGLAVLPPQAPSAVLGPHTHAVAFSCSLAMPSWSISVGPLFSSSTHPPPWRLTHSFKNIPSVRLHPARATFPTPFSCGASPTLPPPGRRRSLPGAVWRAGHPLEFSMSQGMSEPGISGSPAPLLLQPPKRLRFHVTPSIWPAPPGGPAHVCSPDACPSLPVTLPLCYTTRTGRPTPPDFQSQTPPTLGSLRVWTPHFLSPDTKTS